MAITIDGRTFHGNNVQILNGRVIVDGVEQFPDDKLSGVVEIIVTGDLMSLEADATVTVNGNVHGDVETGNSLKCGDVQGNVKAGNSIKCGNIGGSVKAGNSVNHR